jgi:hypothetical protein
MLPVRHGLARREEHHQVGSGSKSSHSAPVPLRLPQAVAVVGVLVRPRGCLSGWLPALCVQSRLADFPRFFLYIPSYNDDTLHRVQRSPRAIHHTSPPTTPPAEPLPPPADSTRCLSVHSIPAARSSVLAPNAVQRSVSENERSMSPSRCAWPWSTTSASRDSRAHAPPPRPLKLRASLLILSSRSDV